MTNMTRAPLRCSAQRPSSSSITAPDGTSSSVWGWFGSTPLSAVIGAPTATAGLPGRNPNFSTFSWFFGSITNFWNCWAAARCGPLTQSASRMNSGLSE